MSSKNGGDTDQYEEIEEVVEEGGIEEEVEEEVIEEEVEEEEMVEDEHVKAPATKASTARSPAAKNSPGRVNPSPAVRDMKMKSPESADKSAGKRPTPNKNPFPSFGTWTEAALRDITIEFPFLTGKNETTNDLTRSTRPEARYWKAPIVFRYGQFTSDTMRFDNVSIPYQTSKGYGTNFIYLCLPGHAANIFAEAGRTKRPTKVTEKSLAPDRARWWKIANNVQNSFGVIDNNSKKFRVRSLETIFDSTQSGVTASVVLKFHFKASTEEKEPLKQTNVGTVAVTVVRGYLSDVNVNIEPPTRVALTKQAPEPTATSSDIASDDLMKRLADLGL